MSFEVFAAYKAEQATPEKSPQPKLELPIWQLTCRPLLPVYLFLFLRVLLRGLSRK